MKILQLCVFTNLWPKIHSITSIDLKSGTDIFSLPDNFGKDFDLVVAAPPCTQFTKANSLNWHEFPSRDICIVEKCFEICKSSAGIWFLENPPGRLETFVPSLTPFRTLNWRGQITNKEYILYSNFLILAPMVRRYGKKGIPRSKLAREVWQPDLINTIANSIFNSTRVKSHNHPSGLTLNIALRI